MKTTLEQRKNWEQYFLAHEPTTEFIKNLISDIKELLQENSKLKKEIENIYYCDRCDLCSKHKK